MTSTIMKKILFIFGILLATLSIISCSDDEWSNDNAEMAHVYYYSLGNVKYPGGNELKYSVTKDNTVAIPTYFFSAFTRSYSPEVWYYTTSKDLTEGVDYQVTDSLGQVLTPVHNGGYSMIWPHAKQGMQPVYIKAISNKKGSLRVLTQDPTITMTSDNVASTSITITDEYEVRAFTENYYVTVNVN